MPPDRIAWLNPRHTDHRIVQFREERFRCDVGEIVNGVENAEIRVDVRPEWSQQDVCDGLLKRESWDFKRFF